MSQIDHNFDVNSTPALIPYDDVDHYYSNDEDGGICAVLQNINMTVQFQITISHPMYFRDLHYNSREIFRYIEELITFIQFGDRFKLYTERNIPFLRYLQERIIHGKEKLDEAINNDNNYAMDFTFERVGLDISKAAFLISAKRKLQLLPPVKISSLFLNIAKL